MYAGSHVNTLDAYYSRSLSDWDMIVRLAVQHGYDAYVRGRDFFFKPARDGRETSIRIGISDCSQIRAVRDVVRERQAPQRVVSWNLQLQQEVVGGALAGTTNAATSSTSVFEPNISTDRLSSVLTQMAQIDDRGALRLQLTMPGETTMSARSTLLIEGVSAQVDGMYRTQCVDRTFNVSTGYVQQVRAIRQVH